MSSVLIGVWESSISVIPDLVSPPNTCPEVAAARAAAAAAACAPASARCAILLNISAGRMLLKFIRSVMVDGDIKPPAADVMDFHGSGAAGGSMTGVTTGVMVRDDKEGLRFTDVEDRRDSLDARRSG